MLKETIENNACAVGRESFEIKVGGNLQEREYIGECILNLVSKENGVYLFNYSDLGVV